MHISRQNPEFEPVTITIENRQELLFLLDALECKANSIFKGAERFRDSCHEDITLESSDAVIVEITRALNAAI